ncbi:MAG: serine hydrolase domain-containing protein [Candidatus Polarisedimenticolia bacterium]
MSRPLDSFLDERIDRGDIPGGVYAVAGPEGILDEGARGLAVTGDAPVTATLDTIYDLASLTKPLVTSLLYLALSEELGLPAGTPVRRLVPAMDRNDKRDITLHHLLTHTSGLPDWLPLYLRGRTMDEYLRQIGEVAPVAGPGARVIYSDLGYILLGEVLARAATATLDELAHHQIASRLGLRATAFRPPAAWGARVAATEDSCHYERTLSRDVAGERAAGYDGFRRGVIRGEVHDQNAWAVGGVAGHAGLFGTAGEVASIAREYLGAGTSMLTGRALDLARHDATPGLEEARSYAFRLALRGDTAAGPRMSGRSFGHNGFTGTSVWIDPETGRIFVLLTNRVHPAVSKTVDMVALRRRFHEVAGSV